MGRKKIEIRPLTDERNRNVTFLKRKAGLMKKAWELSVLCAADVSILIFSNTGKAYEFSSKGLDSEIERYLNYEGMIERRHASEFAAMNLADEDEDEDEDDMVGRGSFKGKNANAGNVNGNGQPMRSLRGKETFKRKTPHNFGDLSDGAHRRGKDEKKRKRSSQKDDGEKKSFIDGILNGSESESDATTEGTRQTNHDPKQAQDEGSRDDQKHSTSVCLSSKESLEGLQYALSMHASAPDSAEHRYSGPAAQQADSYLYAASSASQWQPSMPAQPPRPSFETEQPRIASTSSAPPSHPQAAILNLPVHNSSNFSAAHSFYNLSLMGSPSRQYLHSSFPHSGPQAHSLSNEPYVPSSFSSMSSIPSRPKLSMNLAPNLNGGVHWDQQLLARYAEFQLQQNHQRQQRLLLEKQRQQLAELGVPLDDKSLLDEIFGGVGARTGMASSPIMPLESANNAGSGDPNGMDFIWPLSGGSNTLARNGEVAQTQSSSHEDTVARGRLQSCSQIKTWNFDGVEGLKETGTEGGLIPSPVSARSRRPSGDEDLNNKRTKVERSNWS
nr:hypothetical protein L203_03017 [Cryptococcus depauperatus CBS 7841]